MEKKATISFAVMVLSALVFSVGGFMDSRAIAFPALATMLGGFGCHGYYLLKSNRII